MQKSKENNTNLSTPKSNTNWHAMTPAEVSTMFNCGSGLSSHEAKLRQRHYGQNEIVQKNKKSTWGLFLEQFKSPLIYLLLIVALITFLLHKYIDTGVILAIVFINAFVGWLQEVKAEKSLEAIKKLIAYKSLVIRDNEEKEIFSSEIVPGDMVILNSGQKIPADIRLIEVENLKIDESSLTGESITIRKEIEKISKKTALADRKNMVYASTIVSSGKGIGIVVATANNTEIGKIAKEVNTAQDETAPLNKKILKLGQILLIIIIGVCIMIFALGLWRGANLIEIFLTSIAAAVSAIPEGLPALITIILAIGVHRMVKRNALVRKMQSVETLGGINVIASDKTGTLTLNQMFMDKIYLSSGQVAHIDGKGYDPRGNFYREQEKINIRSNKNLLNLLLTGVLCNDATLICKEKNWLIQGDPTEGSLVVAAAKANITKPEIIKNYPRLDEIQFSSERGYMATLHQSKFKNILAVKGKIETILHLSTNYFDGKKIKEFNNKLKQQIETQATNAAKNAYRILAIAEKRNIITDKIKEDKISDLTYLGFVCLEDPPKTDAIEAITQCKLSGIRPIMITGDHPETAMAIAQKMGIAKNISELKTATDLAKLTPTQMKDIVRSASVFARITPELKLNIVQALQEDGNIVGVTGDGINDAPVLKKADVGIAMGIGGTDVAREASDIVLLDNNFSTIVAAIEEGRTIFLNIRRVIFFLLSTNAGELLILIFCLIINLPLPLIAVQILWINLVTDTTGGIALALEPKHRQIHELRSSRLGENLIDKISIIRTFLVALTMTIGTIILYNSALESGASIEKARSIAFVVMALFQIFNIINAQSMTTSIFKSKIFLNKSILPLMLLSIILTICTTQVTWFRGLFQTQSLNIAEWVIIIIIAATIFLTVEIDKALRKS